MFFRFSVEEKTIKLDFISNYSIEFVLDFSTDVISLDGYTPRMKSKEFTDEGHEIIGSSLANGLLRFRKSGTRFLRQAMRRYFSKDTSINASQIRKLRPPPTIYNSLRAI